MGERAEPKEQLFWVSESSIRRILHDASYMWKASRRSRAVVFKPETDIAFVNYAHAFRRLHELNGTSEHKKQVPFGDESTFMLDEIPAMVWARRCTTSRIVGSDGKSGVSIFLFINGSGEVYNVHGNMGQCHFQLLVDQLNNLMNRFDEDLGSEAGFMLIIDHKLWHYEALRMMTNQWGYYPPAKEEQAVLINSSAPTPPLSTIEDNGSKSRAQLYRIRKPTDANADNARVVLMTTAGVSPFQPDAFLFSKMKERLKRHPETALGHTTSVHGLKAGLEYILKSTSKSVVRECIGAAEHFREA